MSVIRRADGGQTSRLVTLIHRSDTPLLVLALVAVAAYLGDLGGMWAALDLQGFYRVIGLVIDLVFVGDLLLKVAVLRRRYLASPWFVIDLISALPALTWIPAVPATLQAMRFVRAFRFFRILRTLRLVRVLSLFREASESVEENTPEARQLNRALYLSVTVYSVLFLAFVALAEQDPVAEFYLVLGSVLGMVLILVVTRYQVRDLAARHMRALLNIALPRQVAGHFMEHPEAYNHTVHMPATILFSDITGFTSAVEGLGGDLDALKRHLEGVFDAVVAAHVEHDLIVDKFIGDAVMSFRGGDLVEGTPEDHARRVVRAALDSARALARVDDPWFRHMKMGGASAPSAVIGTFGTSSRLSYTILGNHVNLAARLEAACGQLGVGNLFCGRTRALVGDSEGIGWRRVGAVVVKGQAEPHTVYEAFEASELAGRGWVERFHQGLERYEAGDFAAAIAPLEQAAAAREGGDPVSEMYLAICRRLLAQPPGPGWRPALKVSK